MERADLKLGPPDFFGEIKRCLLSALCIQDELKVDLSQALKRSLSRVETWADRLLIRNRSAADAPATSALEALNSLAYARDRVIELSRDTKTEFTAESKLIAACSELQSALEKRASRGVFHLLRTL